MLFVSGAAVVRIVFGVIAAMIVFVWASVKKFPQPNPAATFWGAKLEHTFVITGGLCATATVVRLIIG